ncbi:MAG: phage tail family protein, partial [Eubacterium sp.]|nr:phage tail family protein [Eubacterium sp.]
MHFTLILENETGEQINMTTTANKYMTSEIDGLYPPNGTISTSTYAGMNGSYLNNAFIEKRNIVIHFEMRGIGIEKRRHELYKVVKPSRYIKIYYRTANINVYTEGYVETCEIDNFEQFTSGQISIICPDIYWYSTNTQIAEYSQIFGAFHFIFPDDDKPFPLGKYNTQNMMTIQNDGDETGFTLEISGGPAKNPTLYNAETDEYMQILGDIEEGDIIRITTKTGNKTVTLERGG